MQPLHATHKNTPVRVYHIENGSAYVVLPDGTAERFDWKALRFPKDPAFIAQAPVAQAPATPALLRSVQWGEWVTRGPFIERHGIAEDGTKHRKVVYEVRRPDSWAWAWSCGDSIIHEREGFSEIEWARRDCEAYTAGPTPANAGEK